MDPTQRNSYGGLQKLHLNSMFLDCLSHLSPNSLLDFGDSIATEHHSHLFPNSLLDFKS